MKKRFLLPVFLLVLAAALSNAEDVSAKGMQDIAAVTNNILIGELFPSGTAYLERISMNGGYDNVQRFDDLNYEKQLRLYPLEKGGADHFDARFVKVIKNTYIGGIEEGSGYFLYPFSQSRQNALVYQADKKPGKATTGIALYNYTVSKIIYFNKNDKRKYSKEEYRKAMERVRRDNEAKEQHGSTLAKITKNNTILNATKRALIKIKKIDYDILISTYRTHGMEYASDVYVVDFVKHGTVVMTKEKHNSDGPY
ncbi:MAG TPA: hypothetical protein DCO77_10750 [Nitrospiraceae bacterium]|nr:hypothetical protein [Nitrospiraceae bacterium]